MTTTTDAPPTCAGYCAREHPGRTHDEYTDRQGLGCPSWCATDHDEDDVSDGVGGREHLGAVIGTVAASEYLANPPDRLQVLTTSWQSYGGRGLPRRVTLRLLDDDDRELLLYLDERNAEQLAALVLEAGRDVRAGR